MNAINIYESGEYLANNQTWHSEFSGYKAGEIRKILEKNAIRPSSFVDVGCGSGGIVGELSADYPAARFTGYDVSPQANAVSQSRASENVEFHLGDFTKTEEKYDCLLCIDVFEHVRDYMGFLESLRPRATVMVFHIPLEINVLAIFRQIMLQSRREVGHLHYFHKDTALATLKDCGYDIVDCYYTETFRLLPRVSMMNKLTGFIYRIVFKISKDLAVSLFGDCSLIVLARPA